MHYILLICSVLAMLGGLAFGLYFNQMTVFLALCLLIQFVCIVISTINLRNMRKTNNSLR